MECKECGTELVSSDDKEFQTYVKEYIKLCTPVGLLKGGYRVFNVFRGKLSKTIWEVEGYYYCPKCKTYLIICPRCGHNLQLGKSYPVQGDKYNCPNCHESMIFYYENDDCPDLGDYYPSDYGY